jgi:hypothetical protein
LLLIVYTAPLCAPNVSSDPQSIVSLSVRIKKPESASEEPVPNSPTTVIYVKKTDLNWGYPMNIHLRKYIYNNCCLCLRQTRMLPMSLHNVI